MNELIKIQEQRLDNNELVQTVNARELHTLLEVGKDFSTWIKKRLETLGCQENKDYLIFTQTGENAGRPKNEYFLTIDIAKHVAMMERNQKGFEVRDYFIKCEKKLREVVGTVIPNFEDPIEAAKAWIEQAEKAKRYVLIAEEQAKVIEMAEPKVNYHDIVLACPDLLTVTQISQDYGISAQKLNKILQERKIQYKNKQGQWVLYVEYGAQGYAQTFTHVYYDSNDMQRAKLHLKWTQKGRLFIYDLLKEYDIKPIVEQDS